jgi:activator of 2-hydroxyglutaryl-CoA dehydratase
MISCHALGAFSCNGAVKTIVDIGGQDVKGIAQCSVFAETEVISLLAHNNPPADIAAGIQLAVAKPCFTLLKRVGIRHHVTVSRSLKAPGIVIFFSLWLLFFENRL